jgi:hypothetical protein
MRQTFSVWMERFLVASAGGSRVAGRRPRRGECVGMEPLEVRVMLSVTAAQLVGPINVTGTTWTYDGAYGATDGRSGYFREQATGATTFNGFPAYDIATSTSYTTPTTDAGPGQTSMTHGDDYEGLTAAGAVDYGSTLTLADGTVTSDVNSATDVGYPAELVAGQVYTSTYSTTTTQTAADGTVTMDTANTQEQLVLMSDTETSVRTEAGTYMAYELQDTLREIEDDGTLDDATVTNFYSAPGVGVIETTDSDGNIGLELESFVGGDQLAVTAQPSSTAAGGKIDPVKASELDASGSVDTSASTSITVALASTSTGTGKLTGTTSEMTVDGVATFSDLSIDTPGQYSLIFTDGQGHSTASGLFDVTGGTLKFKVPPTDGTADSPLNPAVVVELEDQDGNVITSDSTSFVTLSPIGLKANPVISGNTAQLVNGIATFSNLKLQNPDFYTLTAADGSDTDVTSLRFKIAGDHLMFRVSPTTADADAPFPVTVGIYNTKNKLDTTATSMLQLSLNVQTGNPSTTLDGTTLVQFVNGLATFTASNGPKVGAPGKYTLTATEEDDSLGVLGPTNLTSAITSKAFIVSGFHLVFKPQPKSTDSDAPLEFTVELVNSKNKVADSVNTGSIALTLLSTPANGGTLSTYTNPGFVQGIDEFSEGISPSIDTPGKSYTLRASALDDSGNPDPTIASVTSTKFQISGLSIKFVKQPTEDNDAGHAIPFTVELVDSHGKINTTETPQISITASPATPISVFTNLHFDQGMAVYTADADGFANIKINALGRYTLTATAINDDGSHIMKIQPGISTPFHVFGYHIAFVQEPENSTSRPGNGSSFVAALEDIHGKIQTANPGDAGFLNIAGIVSVSSVSSGDTGIPLKEGSLDDFTSGEITVAADAAIRPDQPGEYTVRIVGVSATSYDPSPLVESGTSHVFKVFPAHLLFATQPQDESNGFAQPEITIEMQGADGAILNPANDVVQLSYVPVGGPASSAVPLATQTFQPGADAVSFDLLYINNLGSYQLIATIISSPTDEVTTTQETVTPATSRTFTIRR